MQKKISFKNGKGLTLRGVIHLPKNYDSAIIYCHGFPGSAKGSSTKRFAKTFEKLGFLVLRFNFSHTPNSDGKFQDKLMSKEVSDIKYAISFLKKNYKFKKLILIGHSTGAIDASLYACKDKRINKLILSGAVSNLKHAARYDFTDEQMRDFWRKGYIIYKKPKEWVNRKKIKKAFYDEFFTLNIPKAMKKFRRPLLIIHGEKDEAIPSDKDPLEIYKLANKPKKLVILKNADHSYKKKGTWKPFVSQVYKFIK